MKAANPRDMDPQARVPRSTTRLAPLAQAGLAALVAGSLLTFSALAFNTAFDSGSKQQVEAARPATEAPRPVVLAATPPPTRDESNSQDKRVAAPERGTVVLGIRIDRSETREKSEPREAASKPTRRKPLRTPASYATTDTHAKPGNGHGYGHIKAKGKGHHKDHDANGKKRPKS